MLVASKHEDTAMLTDEQIRAFIEDGFVAVRGAVPRTLASRCRDELWMATCCVPKDPIT
ncbi:MAG: hypothetical protein JO100_06470 [Pseudonocardia sp.]|jgi:hypothetical protein|nr:hypothetical protein [Pseudonocardia sp.]